MLALRKLNPQQGAIEIQYAPRVEVVAYPSFQRQSLSVHPHTLDPENYSYVLKAECTASYVAEGTICFPALDKQRHALIFRTSEPLRQEWHLTLGEGTTRIGGAAHKIIAKEYLERVKLGQPRQRNDLADIILKNIRDYFFQEEVAYFEEAIQTGKRLAQEDCQKILEELLAQDPRQQVMPQKYKYSTASWKRI